MQFYRKHCLCRQIHHYLPPVQRNTMLYNKKVDSTDFDHIPKLKIQGILIQFYLSSQHSGWVHNKNKTAFNMVSKILYIIEYSLQSISEYTNKVFLSSCLSYLRVLSMCTFSRPIRGTESIQKCREIRQRYENRLSNG